MKLLRTLPNGTDFTLTDGVQDYILSYRTRHIKVFTESSEEGKSFTAMRVNGTPSFTFPKECNAALIDYDFAHEKLKTICSLAEELKLDEVADENKARIQHEVKRKELIDELRTAKQRITEIERELFEIAGQLI